MSSPGRTPFSGDRTRSIAAFAWMSLAWVAGVLLACTASAPVGDEWVHWPQVLRFAAGDFRVMSDYLTTVPGYHLLLALLVAPGDPPSLAAARALSSLSGLAIAAAFLRIRRSLGDPRPALACAQLLVLPVLFPYLFLVYTDALGLALLLCALAAALERRHGWAALALSASLLVRQHQVFFVLVLAGIALQQAREAAPAHWQRPALRSLLPYGAPLAAFLAYWAWNGSISLSSAQAAAHPDARLDVGNPVLVLALAALLLPVPFARGLQSFVAAARRSRWLWLLPAAVALAYAALFAVSHPYNLAVPEFSLRNGVLAQVSASAGLRAALGGLVVLSACAFAFLPLLKPRLRWVLLLALLFAAGSWMIETRYAIVPMALLLALRRPQADGIEWGTLAAWTLLSLLLAAGMYTLEFGL